MSLVSSSSILSEFSVSSFLKLPFGEEDSYPQKCFHKNEHEHEPHEQLLVEQELLVALQQSSSRLPWNVRFRLIMWILRKKQQQQEQEKEKVQEVGKKRKRTASASAASASAAEVALLLEGIYMDLKISIQESHHHKKEIYWNQDCMLRTWLLVLPNPTNHPNSRTSYFTNNLQLTSTGTATNTSNQIKYRNGMSRYSCLLDLQFLFPLITFPIQQPSQPVKEDIIQLDTTTLHHHANITSRNELTLFQQIIASLDTFVMIYHDQQYKQQPQQSHNPTTFPSRNSFGISFHNDLHSFLEDNDYHNNNNIIQNHKKKNPSSPFTNYSSRLFSNKEKRKKDRQQDHTNQSLFQMHSHQICKLYSSTREDQKQIQKQIKLASKDGRGRYYLEYLFIQLLQEDKEQQIPITTTNGLPSPHNDDHACLVGKALLVGDLMQVLENTHPKKVQYLLGSSSKTKLRLQPSPLASFFGMTKQEFTRSLFQSNQMKTTTTTTKTIATTTTSPSHNPIQQAMAHATSSHPTTTSTSSSSSTTTDNIPYHLPISPSSSPPTQSHHRWKIEEENITSEDNLQSHPSFSTQKQLSEHNHHLKIEEDVKNNVQNEDSPYQTSFSTHMMNNVCHGDTKNTDQTKQILSSISEVGLEVCLENFLKGTSSNNSIKPVSLNHIFDGFTSSSDNNYDVMKNHHQHPIPDVTELVNDLFDLLVYKSILSSNSSSNLEGIDAVAEKNGGGAFLAQDDVNTILHMAKQFAMWLPWNPLVEKFRICLSFLLCYGPNNSNKYFPSPNHPNKDQSYTNNINRIPLLQKWTLNIAEIIRELSLSSKVTLLHHLVKFYGNVSDPSRFATPNKNKYYYSNLCETWSFLVDKRFCETHLLDMGWESDLATCLFFSSLSGTQQQQQYLDSIKSTNTSKMLMCTFLEGILDSLKRYQTIMGEKLIKYSCHINCTQRLENLLWCVYSMTTFFPYCMDMPSGTDCVETNPFYGKVNIVNARLRNICNQILTDLSFCEGDTANEGNISKSLPFNPFHSNIRRARGALSFEIYIQRLITFAIKSKWRNQQPLSWCKFIVHNIILETYLSTDSQHECNNRNRTSFNSCCLLKIWTEQLHISLMKKSQVERTQDFQMSPLLKTIHQCIIKMCVLNGRDDNIGLHANRVNSLDPLSKMLIRLQHVGKRRFSQFARSSSWNEIFCNTDARYLFHMINSCCHDDGTYSAESIVEKCLYLSGNYLPVVSHLFYAVGIFIDNQLKRFKYHKDDVTLNFHHTQYYQTEFQNSSRIKQYIEKMKPFWENQSKWILLLKKVHFDLKANSASLGLVWWENLIKDMDVNVNTSKKESIFVNDSSFWPDDNGWDNLSDDSEKMYNRNGMSIEDSNHQPWSGNKAYPSKIKSESSMDFDLSGNDHFI